MDPLLATALEAAEAAADVHLTHFGRLGVEEAREKGQSDFVSQVDLQAQAAAVAVIRSRYPDHRILAEEDEPDGSVESNRLDLEAGSGFSGSEDVGTHQAGTRCWPGGGGFLWIIDPLDGTTNFLHRHPFFAASVAVGHGPSSTGEGASGFRGSGTGVRVGGFLEAGAVVAPVTGERWWAGQGKGAWKNGLRIRASKRPSLQSSLVGTGFPFKARELLPRYMAQFQEILPRTSGVRRAGSAAIDLCHLAEGVLDAFWEEAYLSPWDVAAGLLILAEAGGVASRADGSEIDLENGSILAAGSPSVYQELFGILSSI